MRYYRALFLLVFLAACGRENKEHSKQYFDLKGYFAKEAERLKKQNPTLIKTVTQNQQTEQKEVKLSSWETELSLFSESDVNKPAWKHSYDVVTKANLIEYISKDKQLKTKKIAIHLSGDSVKRVSILNTSQTILYSSTEELYYIPDSLYQIKKSQTVRIIGANTYTISARFKN